MDMIFRDDECRIRTNHAPANFTTLRVCPRTSGGIAEFSQHEAD